MDTTLTRAAKAAEAGKDPAETIESEQGAYEDAAKGVSEDARWGGGLNPVRDTPSATKGLKQAG